MIYLHYPGTSCSPKWSRSKAGEHKGPERKACTTKKFTNKKFQPSTKTIKTFEKF